jgi:hypothetical protein
MVLLFRAIWLIATLALSYWSLFTKDGRDAWGWFFRNIVGGALSQAAPLVAELGPAVHDIAVAFSDAITSHGGGIAATLGSEFQKVAKTMLDAQQGALASRGESTPDNAIDNAAEAFTVAFGAGLSAAGVAALFEAVFPEKLNTLNGTAPMLATMAGFEEVAREVLHPLYHAAFGKSLEYHYRSKFKPELPSEQDAVTWHSRRLISDAELRSLFQFSGLKDKYEEPFITSAYRALQPRMLATAIDDTAFDPEPMRDAMRFAGLRDDDIDLAIDAFTAASLKGLRKAVVAAAEANFVAGLTSDTEFSDSLDTLNISNDAKDLIILAATEKRLKALTEDYRKGVDAQFLAREIDAADYRVQLSGLGYSSPVLDGIVGGMSGKIDAIEFKQEGVDAKLYRRKEQELAIQASMTAFKRAEIDLPALTAALAVAGLDLTQVALYVALAEARGQTVAAKKKVARTEAQKLEIKAADEEYLKGDIDANQLRIKLSAAGMDHAAIDAETEYLNARGAKGQ